MKTGYAACFESALQFVAQKKKVSVADSKVTAIVGIGPNDKGGFQLAVKLQIHLPNLDRNEAQALVETAHQVCPYSNATRGNIEVELELA